MKTPYEDPLLAQQYDNALAASKKQAEYFNGKDIGPEALTRCHEVQVIFHKTLRNMDAGSALKFAMINGIAADREETKALVKAHKLLPMKK